MVFQLFKRLVVEDFEQSQQALIGKIATVYNPMIDQLNSGLKSNLDFNNLNQEVITFKVTVDSSGVPTSTVQLTPKLKTNLQGIICINAVNNTDSTTLSGAPFIAFSRSSGTATITQVTGLVAGKSYTITAIFVG
jgi:hypothetical protein